MVASLELKRGVVRSGILKGLLSVPSVLSSLKDCAKGLLLTDSLKRPEVCGRLRVTGPSSGSWICLCNPELVVEPVLRWACPLLAETLVPVVERLRWCWEYWSLSTLEVEDVDSDSVGEGAGVLLLDVPSMESRITMRRRF